MKLLTAPRQPFVGLTLVAATGIIVAEVVPLAPTALISTALVFGICILICAVLAEIACDISHRRGWLFFCCTSSLQRTLQASNSRMNLASDRASSQQSDM